MEKDDEVKGDGNSLDFRNRIYDPRIGKFLSVDALTNKFPELTPYQFASNTPIWAIDIDGLEAFFIHGMNGSPDQWRTKEFQEVAKTVIQLTNNTEQNANFNFDWSAKRNGPLQRKIHRTRAAKQLADYVIENRAGGEEITLVGVSHGGNVSIQAAKIIEKRTGEKVNLITINTTNFDEEGDSENPNGNSSINDRIDIRTENDKVSKFVRVGKGEKKPNNKSSVESSDRSLRVTNDEKFFLNRHATKNIDIKQIKNSKLTKLKPVPNR
jgi:RHS repeat-associated protein